MDNFMDQARWLIGRCGWGRLLRSSIMDERVSRVAVLTGAGISTDSGIPDYRGPQGVWTRDPRLVNAFTYPTFMRDAAVRAQFWKTYAGHAAWQATPNAAHRALAELEHSGVAVRVLTQNVDGLHQKAGSTPRKVLELHGTMHEVVCTGCAARTPSRPTLDRVTAGEDDPHCTTCGGILKLAVVLFGENLNAGTAAQAERIAAHSELLVAVGTSLQVEPVASLCAVALNAGHRLVFVNRDPTPYDDDADEVIREPIGTALPRLCAAWATASRSR
jgi:NAD-dependent deacetylase